MCQCPISGYPHFYTRDHRACVIKKVCVNALSRAIPISTMGLNVDYLQEAKCQCPISGYPHFYQIMIKRNDGSSIVCQCPVSGYPPFLLLKSCQKNLIGSCVNALSRAIPISTKLSYLNWEFGTVCQCPVSGYPHFYLRRNSLRQLS